MNFIFMYCFYIRPWGGVCLLDGVGVVGVGWGGWGGVVCSYVQLESLW